MDHFLSTARLCDTAVDDLIGDPDLLCDVADSSMWDVTSDVDGPPVLLDLPDDDSFTAEIINDTDKYAERQKASDNTVALSAGLTFDGRCASASDSLRRNMSKNAMLARQNREKKKRYICGLEKTVRDLSVKNKKLVHGCTAMHNTIANLRREVNYLRGVIENQSELARLLKHIPVAGPTQQLQENANLSLFDDESRKKNASVCIDHPASLSTLNSSELIHTKLMPTADCQSLLTEHDYARSDGQGKRNSSPRQFGVCLHVAKQVTSLQLCASCNENAQ